MRRILAVIIAALVCQNLQAQVTNSSYVNQYGEKVLQLSIIVPTSLEKTWQLFTTDEGLKKWIAPVVKIDMRTGGSIRTNYDASKTVDDSSFIQLGIINFIENQMLTLKVNLNNNFPPEAKNEDKNLQEILQFVKVNDNQTKIISSMVGWGQGPHWDKTYDFFEKGNEWTFNEVLKVFQK